MDHPVPQAHLRGSRSNGHRQPDGQPFQPHREHHKEHHGNPERRCAGGHQAVARHQLICQPAPFPASQDTQKKADGAGQQPGGRHKPHGVYKTLADYLSHRPAVQKGNAQISPQNVLRPACETGERRHAHTPVFPQLFHLLRAHGAQGGLAHVGGQGVHGRDGQQQKYCRSHKNQQHHHTYELSGDPFRVVHVSPLLVLFCDSVR